jgi:hypothetical protein
MREEIRARLGELVREFPPIRVESPEQLDAVQARVDELLGRERDEAEDLYLDLLGSRIKAWEEVHERLSDTPGPEPMPVPGYGEPPYRVGTKGHQTIYDSALVGDGGQPGNSLGRMDTPQVAALVVASVNTVHALRESMTKALSGIQARVDELEAREDRTEAEQLYLDIAQDFIEAWMKGTESLGSGKT